MMGLPQGEQEHDDAERWLQLIEPADIPKFRGALEACLQGLSQKLNVVFRVRHYQGGTRIFNARATARAPEHGTIRRSEEHTSELQSLMRISYAVFCLKKKQKSTEHINEQHTTRKNKDQANQH